MSRPIYRRGKPYARRVRTLLFLTLHPEQDETLDCYQLALVRNIRERLTSREKQCLSGYYVKGQCLSELADCLGINISTVSRNIHRGEEKLDQTIRMAEQISPVRPERIA